MAPISLRYETGGHVLFPTVEFAIFFLAVFGISWSVKNYPWTRKLLLVGASYAFYAMWDVRFLFLLLECSLVNYLFGVWIQHENDPRRRKLALGIAVGCNLAVLGFFKYWGFFLSSAADALRLAGWERDIPIMDIILPVGISFFTFQGISYVVDVYKRKVPAVESLVDLLLYISFFPQLVAGPIVRAADFLPQLRRQADADSIPLASALILIFGGLFKKIVLAHYLATELVNPVFEAPEMYGAFDLLIGAYGYAIQIYCDFSAYSDMAIGFAALLGFHFPANFNQPYRAESVRDFWRRWHISLSSWLRDYLYIPLGGSKGAPAKTYRNLMLTMILGGLWHGAAWNFVFWGVAHGLALMAERIVAEFKSMPPLARPIKVFLVFHFVCATWIFFASDTLDKAWAYLAGLGRVGVPISLMTPFVLSLLVIGMAIHFVPLDWRGQMMRFIHRQPAVWQGTVAGALLVILASMAPGALAPFIYFRF